MIKKIIITIVVLWLGGTLLLAPRILANVKLQACDAETISKLNTYNTLILTSVAVDKTPIPKDLREVEGRYGTFNVSCEGYSINYEVLDLEGDGKFKFSTKLQSEKSIDRMKSDKGIDNNLYEVGKF